MRIKTRLQNADVTYNEMVPVLLPGNHLVMRLIILQAHRIVLHGGVNDTLTELRSQFRVLRARQAVKRVLRKCVIYVRFRMKAASVPVAPLSSDVVCYSCPFEVTGVCVASVRERLQGWQSVHCTVHMCSCMSHSS